VVDTGYLFPETYRFIDELTERLRLNLKVYRSPLGPAWQEARWGKLWEQGLDGIERYNRINKVEPMQRALDELDARGWIVGLRRAQASTRRELKVLGIQDGYLKVHPIVDWNDKHVYDYLTRHDLPYHPLWEQGYPSIGDWHTSHKLTDGMTEEETRFFGLKRECGCTSRRRARATAEPRRTVRSSGRSRRTELTPPSPVPSESWGGATMELGAAYASERCMLRETDAMSLRVVGFGWPPPGARGEAAR
jgi:phosphoadenylyl-sulfate reductase (thioredoxin)